MAAAKTLFSGVYVIDTTCFDECFLLCVITGEYRFSGKINATLRFFKRHVGVLKEVRILCINSTVTI